MLIIALLLSLSFVIALALDLLAIRWHAARERRDAKRGALLAGALEALTWAPVAFAIEVGNVFAIAGACIAGSIVANLVGLRARGLT